MSRFRIPGGIGYQSHYPLGSIQDGTLVRTNTMAPASVQHTASNPWRELSYEAKARIATANVDVNRVLAVAKAIKLAKLKIAPMLVAELGVRVDDLMAAVIPALLIMLCCVASTTALGATVGAVVGFILGAAAGAAPGAVMGGAIGLDAGIAILTWMGLIALVEHVGKDLAVAIDKATRGLQTAWDAGNKGASQELRLEVAATQLASAVVHFYLAIVNAFLALITKGAAATSVNNLKANVSKASLAEGLAKIEKSKILGKTVATWFEKTTKRL
jgi:hypothetical protein